MIIAFEGTEKWLVELAALGKKFEQLHKETASNEEEWREGQMKRERLMDELDGTNMTEEEFEQVVELQMPSNPHRMKLKDATNRLWRAV